MNKDYFTIFFNGVEKSQALKDFLTPSVAFEITAGQFLHVGYRKPFSQLYIEFETPEVASLTQTYEYYNGTAWAALDVLDETLEYKQSGFISFIRPDDWAATTVGSEELFYIRISSDLDLTIGTKIKGINILFSNDLDLQGIRSNIVSTHNNGNSWIDKHEEARKFIIQRLRNAGHRVFNENVNALSVDAKNTVLYKDLTQFDLLDPFELREASKYYAISMIYLNELSDADDDKWQRAGERYLADAQNAIELFMLKIDVDDDGIEDAAESSGLTRTSLEWA